MASPAIGKIKKGANVWEVKWDGTRVYVRKMGGGLFGNPTQSVGSASSAQEAMTKAEAFLYNK